MGLLEVRLDYNNPMASPVSMRPIFTSETRGIIAGAWTQTSVSVSCFCKGCCVSCVVRVNSSITINSLIIPTSSHPEYAGFVNHERRHVMSDAYVVRRDIVAPLSRESGKTKSTDGCTNKSQILRNQYQAMVNSLSTGRHWGEDGSTPYSPGDGIPWQADLGISAWNSAMQAGRKPQGQTSVTFGSCNQ